jgi:uncharacterized RDD family membrane protein YckC
MSGSELRIRTPEGIAFAYQLAGPVTRCLAWAIDIVVITIFVLSASMAITVFTVIDPDFASGLSFVAFFVIQFGYGVVFEWGWRGQTVGKRLLRLRVMDADGLRLQFHQILMRNLVRFADLLPGCYLVGGLACLFTRKAQRLGDLAAGTVVVHHSKPLEPDLEKLLGNKYNSLRSHPHLAARLRQRATPAEARFVLQALIRRDEFEAGARVRLFAEMAEHFRGLVAFPPEVIEGMPDEQFVRNVVDVLFRTQAAERVPAGHAEQEATEVSPVAS